MHLTGTTFEHGRLGPGEMEAARRWNAGDKTTGGLVRDALLPVGSSGLVRLLAWVWDERWNAAAGA